MHQIRRAALPPLAVFALLAACASADRIAGPRHRLPRPALVRHATDEATDGSVDAIRRRLERAADGLLYTSESDYPFTWFFHAGPVQEPLDVAAFRAALAIPAETRVEVVSLDDFFARHIERVDPYDAVAVALVPRYARLRETIRRDLRLARVFRVGEIAIDCYIVGLDEEDDLLGLTTIAIET